MTGLVTFGETMLRYTPPEDGRLAAADALSVTVGGAESNVAIAAQQLGCESTWLSKLPEGPLAERVRRTVREYGVEPVVATGSGRVGTYYLETGGEPRGANVVYDREGAAVRTATPDELAVERIRAAERFATSGITPALSGTLADTVAALFDSAAEAGTRVVFDLNYRAKLWPPAAARETLRDLLPAVDTLVVAARDAETVLERSGDAESVAHDLAGTHGIDTVVVTRGADGAVAARGDETVVQPAFETDSRYPVGAGDAFVGGLVAERHRGASLDRALAVGAATAALARTVPGDVADVTRAEVEAVLDGGSAGISR